MVYMLKPDDNLTIKINCVCVSECVIFEHLLS